MKRDALVAEFIGTFTLIFIGVGAIASNHLSEGALGLTGIALAHGLAIAVMVSATAAVSGGHLNPAVTLGVLSIGKIDAAGAVGYIIAQCAGAIAAAIVIKSLFPADALAAVNMGTPALAESISVGQGIGIEIILTFFLIFVIMGTAIDSRAPQVGGLFIGLTVALDILAGGPLTGAAMNPARHLGPALMGGGMSQTWIFWLAPAIGGILAAQVYGRCILEKKSE